MIWLLSSPLPTPLLSVSLTGNTREDRSREKPCWRERKEERVRSQIIGRGESLVLYTTLHLLWMDQWRELHAFWTIRKGVVRENYQGGWGMLGWKYSICFSCDTGVIGGVFWLHSAHFLCNFKNRPFLSGTIRPNQTSLEVIPLDRPRMGHQPIYIFDFLNLSLHFNRVAKFWSA